MKNHLKRIAAPKTWFINRKSNTFILRPNPGAHSFHHGLPLGVILRDMLAVASTMGEVRKVLHNKDVFVDGVKRNDHRFLVGLFDVVSLPELKKQYRLVLDVKGRLVLSEITEKESGIKISKIVGKTALRGGKIQFNLHDGKNIVTDAKASVGDSFVVTLPALKIAKILPLKAGMHIFLTQGKHAGDSGVLKGVKGREATYSAHDVEIDTAKQYLFVVGEKGAEIKTGP